MRGPISAREAVQRRNVGLAALKERNVARLPRADCFVLSTFNVDLFPPLLSYSLREYGFYGEVEVGMFGQIAQQAMNPASALYAAQPANVVLITAVEDLLAPLFDRPSRFSAEAAADLIGEQLEQLERSIRTILERLPDATCYVVAIGSDRVPSGHVLDPTADARGQRAVERLLHEIRSVGSLSARVVAVDWETHVRSAGTAPYRDPRLWYLGRMRLNPAGLAALGDLVARHVGGFRGAPGKVIALDLDNTLWGGVVGEAGLSGLQLGDDGIGGAFRDFQRELLKLHDAGVLLVAVSKNNADDALEVFDRHSGMILQREHLAGYRINWTDKATNLRELAAELNLGIESFVFLDDNPVEREWIRQGAPEVRVPELPTDPAERPDFLRGLPWFDRIRVTDADVSRAASYMAQRHRKELASAAASFDDFLTSLEQELVIEPVHEGSVGRAAQMAQRTNQFNLTTRRYTAADIERMMHDDAYELYTAAVRDRFGDSGITGMTILRKSDSAAAVEIDTFLLSCRVLGRKVEDAFLSVAAKRAREMGAKHLVGRYAQTAKNAQVASFYVDRGFEMVGEGEFVKDLAGADLDPPPFIDIKVATYA